MSRNLLDLIGQNGGVGVFACSLESPDLCVSFKQNNALHYDHRYHPLVLCFVPRYGRCYLQSPKWYPEYWIYHYWWCTTLVDPLENHPIANSLSAYASPLKAKGDRTQKPIRSRAGISMKDTFTAWERLRRFFFAD